MVSNQVLGTRLAAGLLVLALTLCGCSWRHSRESESTAAPVTRASTDSQSAVPVPGDMTATEAAINASPSTEVSPSSAPPDAGIINPTAPKRYVVKRGDTLWGIASMFLRDPWLWPEVWYINPQVANPHLIYPGDTLSLAHGADGHPQIRLEQGGAARLDPRLRTNPLDGAIPAISYQAIAAFLSRPSVLTPEQVKNAPYVLAFRDEHEVAGSGNEIYVRNLNGPDRARYSVVHVGEPLRDPDDGKVVGYQGVYTGTALVSKPGKITKAVLIDTARETLRGDKVMPSDTDVPLNFMPSAPHGNVHGRIIAVEDGTFLIGQYQVVVINRGTRDGLANGNVLAIDQAGERVRDTYANGASFTRSAQDMGTSFARKVKLPDERTGTLLVFRTFDRVSYGLVVGATDTIHIQDIVHNP
ncbi:MAG: LysM peptidoglycan-binding domain-containing protein [Steroidobacteraceae bacterium]